uniref:Stromal cell-derived factor 1 n=1 Tax=Bos indicus x Bos taurus TaxID=30522 RepID=A0A4W2EQS6_BOBOX
MDAKVFVVLALVLTALCLSDAKPVSLSYRCPCRFFESHVAKANVKHLKILNTPNCSLQIVARLKNNNRQVCIDPKLKWIQEYLDKALNKTASFIAEQEEESKPTFPELWPLCFHDVRTWTVNQAVGHLDLTAGSGRKASCVKEGGKPLLSRRISQLETAREPLSVSFSGDWKGERGLGGLGKGSLTPRCRSRAEPGTRGQPPGW